MGTIPFIAQRVSLVGQCIGDLPLGLCKSCFLVSVPRHFDSESAGAGENKILLDTVYHPSAQAAPVFGMDTVR